MSFIHSIAGAVWVDIAATLPQIGFKRPPSKYRWVGFNRQVYFSKAVCTPRDFINAVAPKLRTRTQVVQLRRFRQECRELWSAGQNPAETQREQMYPYHILDFIGGEYLGVYNDFHVLCIAELRNDFTLLGHFITETGEMTEPFYNLMQEVLTK